MPSLYYFVHHEAQEAIKGKGIGYGVVSYPCSAILLLVLAS